MSLLISIPIILILTSLQITVARQVTLLNGTVDLLLLWVAAWSLQGDDLSSWFCAVFAVIVVSYVSALPWYVYLISYASLVILAKMIRSRLWQSQLISMFLLTFAGSTILYLSSFLIMQFTGGRYNWGDSLSMIIIPSLFLNLFIAIPIFALVRDTTNWVIKREVS